MFSLLNHIDNCSLYRPVLPIAFVVGSVPTEAWADPQRGGKCGSPLRGGADCGGRALPTTNGHCVYDGHDFETLKYQTI